MGDQLRRESLSTTDEKTPLAASEILAFREQIPGWQIMEEDGVHHLRREFSFVDFSQALLFANKVGEKADARDHHPRLVIEWGQATVEWWTHEVNGLHESDFIMAAETDDIYIRWKLISGQKEAVQQVSEESFPASDPPAR